MSSARVPLVVLIAVACACAFVPSAGAQTINLWSNRVVATPPSVDGAVGGGEWPWMPQITIGPDYVNPSGSYGTILPDAPTYTTFAFTDTDLYILVDVVGDASDDDWDECLFWLNNGTASYSLRISGNTASPSSDSVGGDRAIGFGPSPHSATPHRIFEFRVPLAALGVQAGDAVAICSPYFKSPPPPSGGGGSMGYDGKTGRDNIWPPDLDPNTISTWASLRLRDPGFAIPALGVWGALLLSLLIGAAAVAALRR